jgi:hypothetical protein
MVAKSVFLAGCLCVVLAAPSSVPAGMIGLSWDASAGAAGYTVYYGPSAGAVSSQSCQPPVQCETVTGATQTVISNLGDCERWYFAVSANNAAGESGLSEIVNVLPRPSVTDVDPPRELQGTQFTLTVTGNNFDPDAELEIDNPNIELANSTVTCGEIQVAATVHPMFPDEQAAEIGSWELRVRNPANGPGAEDDIVSVSTFEVLLEPMRLELNAMVPSTNRRIDKFDLATLKSLWTCGPGCSDFDYDVDINGDGVIDGADLAYMSPDWGQCWDAASQTWTVPACVGHPSQN